MFALLLSNKYVQEAIKFIIAILIIALIGAFLFFKGVEKGKNDQITLDKANYEKVLADQMQQFKHDSEISQENALKSQQEEQAAQNVQNQKVITITKVVHDNPEYTVSNCTAPQIKINPDVKKQVNLLIKNPYLDPENAQKIHN